MTSSRIQHSPDIGRVLTAVTTMLPAAETGPSADQPSPLSCSAVVVLGGRLDAVEAPELRAILNRALFMGAANLVIDLAAVTFIDSAGLAALVRARRDAQAVGGSIILIAPSDTSALRVFRLTQFDEVFLMVASRVDG